MVRMRSPVQSRAVAQHSQPCCACGESYFYFGKAYYYLMKPHDTPVGDREVPREEGVGGVPLGGAQAGVTATSFSVPPEHCALRGYVKMAWEWYRRRALRLSGAAALTVLLVAAVEKIAGVALPTFAQGVAVLYAESWLIAGFTLFAFATIAGQAPSWRTLFYAPRVPHAALVVFLQLLLTIAGMLLFLVPAVLLSVVYSVALLLYLEGREKTVLGAFRTSARMVRGKFWRVAAALALLWALMLAGLMAAGVGVVITLPLSILGFFALYCCLRDEYDRTPAHGTSWIARNTTWVVPLLAAFALLFLLVITPFLSPRESAGGGERAVPSFLREQGTA